MPGRRRSTPCSDEETNSCEYQAEDDRILLKGFVRAKGGGIGIATFPSLECLLALLMPRLDIFRAKRHRNARSA